MKLCKDCSYFLRGGFGTPLCTVPGQPDPVHGKPTQRFCNVERNTVAKNYCGPEARFFKATEEVA